ncbi:MAG: rRNA pseudouridine synthase [Desulfovibrionaceae bacterium]|nr:rRNA pseudouridine synthase [Desulfovibrionaceae bacterium]
MRLNKALADAGLCSRRKADALVFSGVVRVNGRQADSPGLRVRPGRDRIEVNGRPVSPRPAPDGLSDRCWLMLHKPAGVVATARDPEGRRTVLDLVPPPWKERRLYPVGRLDFFSEGLLLITDDGQLAHRLSHPRWHLPRVYEVRVRPEPGAVAWPRALEIMRGGMALAEGERLAPVDVDVVAEARSGRGAGVLLKLTLRQGLNRQIRRMCRDLGLTVLRLRRVAQGPLHLGDLPAGRVRPLREDEVAALRKAVGL